MAVIIFALLAQGPLEGFGSALLIAGIFVALYIPLNHAAINITRGRDVERKISWRKKNF